MTDSTRSCRGCPSFLTSEDAGKFFDKSIGAPMCARFGRVLGGADILPVAEAKLQEQVASNCTSYGDSKPKTPQGFLETNVTLPHPEVVSELASEPSSDDDKAMVNTCLNCRFYVEPEKVIEDKGWAAGLCGATGRLLLPNRLTKEASNCDYRKYGSSSRLDPGKMHLIPMYQEAKSYDPSPLGRYKKMKASGGMVDPAEYPSDLDVSDDDRESGIRAWRRIEDPNGTGNVVHLPIFDPDFFDPIERTKIPRTGDDEAPEAYIDSKDYVYSVAVEWMELDETPFLIGQPGVGKTELLRHIAWLMQAPFDRISITREMEVEDLIGKMLFIEGETQFQWGRLPHRWVKPGVLCLDEINAGPDAVWQRCRPLFDNSKQLVLDEAGAEKVERHGLCFVGLTGNPAWDARNVGVNEIADADTNRLAHLMMHLPPADVEREILIDRCEKDGWTPDKVLLDTLMKNSEEIRALSEDGSLPVTWGIRQNIKVARHLKWFDPITSYKRAVADALEPQVAEMILNIVRTNGQL